MSQYPVVLAIDFGTKRIGLAISRGTLAEPLCIVPNNDQALLAIKQICEAEQVTQIVVGLSENEMARLTETFVEELKKVVKLPITFTDETLTSHTVGGKLKERGASLRQRQLPIDHLAAAEFLQEYLDEHPT